jgi:hypothetical protein
MHVEKVNIVLYEQFYLLRYDAVKSDYIQPIAACLMLVSCFAYSSILNMEATPTSETLVDFHWTT